MLADDPEQRRPQRAQTGRPRHRRAEDPAAARLGRGQPHRHPGHGHARTAAPLPGLLREPVGRHRRRDGHLRHARTGDDVRDVRRAAPGHADLPQAHLPHPALGEHRRSRSVRLPGQGTRQLCRRGDAGHRPVAHHEHPPPGQERDRTDGRGRAPHPPHHRLHPPRAISESPLRAGAAARCRHPGGGRIRIGQGRRSHCLREENGLPRGGQSGRPRAQVGRGAAWRSTSRASSTWRWSSSA